MLKILKSLITALSVGRAASKAQRVQPTRTRMTMSDGREYIQWSDGSWRRRFPKPLGKAAVKLHKKLRARQREVQSATA